MDNPFPAYRGDEPYIFVSYAHADDEIVYPEIQWLHDQGFNVWYDEGISPGTVWRDELADSIEGSSLFLYFVTPQSIGRAHCQREVNFAVDHEIPLLAVHLEETDLPSGMNLTLSSIQAILRYELSDQDYRTKLLSASSASLQRGIAGSGLAPTTRSGVSRRSVGVLVFTALVFGGLFTGLLTWNLKPTEPDQVRLLNRFTIDLPPGVRAVSSRQPLAISTDGRRIVFSGEGGEFGDRSLYSRLLEELEAVPIRGSETAVGIYGSSTFTLSPDGEWVVFADYSDNTFKKVRVTGGAPFTISDTTTTHDVWGLAWGANGIIVFGTPIGLMQVSDAGGEPELLTIPEQGEYHGMPHFLQDGSALVFRIVSPTEPPRVAVLSMVTGVQRILLRGSSPHVVNDGHLLFLRENVVWGAGFDLDRLELTTQAVPLLEGVELRQGFAHFDVASNGSLTYVHTDDSEQKSTLVWVDRQGKEQQLAAEPDQYFDPRVSPDGQHIAVVKFDGNAGSDIWIYSRESGISSPFTFGDGYASTPVWTADGARLIYALSASGDLALFSKAADGTGTAKQLTTSEHRPFPTSLSSNRETLVFQEYIGETRVDLGVLSLQGESQVAMLLQSEFNEQNAVLSPDGELLAYESDKSGRPEIYVRPFPNIDAGLWRVSTDGGQQPCWGPDGRELFYWSPAGMMAAAVETEPTFKPGKLNVLFDLEEYEYGRSRNYDLAPDGERFLMVKPPITVDSKIVVVENWSHELERLIPTN